MGRGAIIPVQRIAATLTKAKEFWDDRSAAKTCTAIDGRDRQLPCSRLLRSGYHAHRGLATADMDGRTLFRHARALARRQGRPARSGDVSSRLCDGNLCGIGAVA